MVKIMMIYVQINDNRECEFYSCTHKSVWDMNYDQLSGDALQHVLCKCTGLSECFIIFSKRKCNLQFYSFHLIIF